MRILFVGSKNMGRAALAALVDFQQQGALEIAAVVARDDDDADHWYASVSRPAREQGLRVLMPTSLTDPAFLEEIRALEPDLGLCCFYPKLFREPFFSIPRHGFVNLHFAPLPRYRGALPIPHAIRNGEREHGVTMHVIDAGMDSGAIVSQVLVPLNADDTGYDLYTRCERAGLVLFHETLQRILDRGALPPTRTQDPDDIIAYRRKDMKSLEVDPAWERQRLYDFVRAFDFPPFDLPFWRRDGSVERLAVRPDRHGLDPGSLEFLEHGRWRIYRIPDPQAG